MRFWYSLKRKWGKRVSDTTQEYILIITSECFSINFSLLKRKKKKSVAALREMLKGIATEAERWITTAI